MELAGLDIALAESEAVSERGVSERAGDIPVHYCRRHKRCTLGLHSTDKTT